MDGDVKNAQNEMLLGGNVRLPLADRNKVTLVGQVGAAIGYTGDDPQGADNNTSTLQAAVDYGVSVEYWYSAHWCLSFTARNAFLQYRTTTTETPVTDDNVDSSTDFGVIWDPAVDAALHLFF